MMERFKYYKRGKGELDSSNFPLIKEKGRLFVETLDEKTFVSLLALNCYLETMGSSVKVFVDGYVCFLRSDKDLFHCASVFEFLYKIDIFCLSPQHESTEKIKTNFISKGQITRDLNLTSSLLFVGADKSVAKFMPEIDICANKVRETGKVTSCEIDFTEIITDKKTEIVIVDDILGGGATIQMVVDKVKTQINQDIDLHLWVAYNEGIHTEDFLKQFSSVFLGDQI